MEGEEGQVRKRRSRFDQDGPQEPAAKLSRTALAVGGAPKPSLSLDAIQKAKAALQKHKDLAEKLKNMPQLQAVAAAKKAAAAMSAPTTSPGATAGGLGGLQLGAISVGFVGQVDPLDAPTRASGGIAQPGVLKATTFAAASGSLHAPSQRPMALRLNAEGQEVDEHGIVVERKTTAVATLKVNITQQKISNFNDILEKQKIEEKEAEDKVDKFYDPRMSSAPKPRGRRANFEFVEKGKLERVAQRSRLKNQYGDEVAKQMLLKEKQDREAARRAAALGSSDPNMIPLGQRPTQNTEAAEANEDEDEEKVVLPPIPNVEWWDKPLLKNGTYDDILDGRWNIRLDKINLYVEHPILMYPPAEPEEPALQPLKLTKRENKKLRTQRRLAMEKERQEMVKQGLLEPPKPKVKISNLMRVMGMEATQDPTAIEKEVRSQMSERQNAHDDRNLARKLTENERREKKLKKLFEDTSTPETLCAIYKIKDMKNKHNQYKVDINAQENRLSGVCLLMEEEAFSMVIVEGMSKALKRYMKLMLRRIDWNEGKDDDEEDAGEPNKCVLVWQGAIEEPAFKRFKFETCRTKIAAKKLLVDAGVGHYWDVVANADWEGIAEVQ